MKGLVRTAALVAAAWVSLAFAVAAAETTKPASAQAPAALGGPDRATMPSAGMRPAGPTMPPMPYAVCLQYCTASELPFMQCHATCKELVPLPPTLK